MHIFSVEHKTAEWAAIRMEGSQGSSNMKISNVFTKLAPTLFIFFFYGLRFTFLSLTIRIVPAGWRDCISVRNRFTNA